MRCVLALLISAGLQAGGAVAQTRVVVVPAGNQVIVPPRGGALPASVQRRAPRNRRQAPPLEEEGGLFSGSGLAVPFLALLPLAAAAALSASLPGSGGGTSSPARTR